jgi:uncharacterized protein
VPRRTLEPRGGRGAGGSPLITFFDTSALVKRYVAEEGSAELRRRLAESVAAVARLSEIEVASAVVRRYREGGLDLEDRDRILAALEHDFTALYVVELSPVVARRARRLLVRHALRLADALQLASCLELAAQLQREVALAAFDERLLAAAQAEGLRTN